MTEASASRVVIVGAGQAALSCAAKLRQLGFAGSITLCGDEPELPYQRPPLSKKYLTGEMSRERLLLRPTEWYENNAINVRTGVKVEAIDRIRKHVSLSSGHTLDYDWLVLATGSRPRSLPIALTRGLQGIHSVRSLADVDRLGSDMRQSKSAVILGGGYIGLEAASVLVKQGLAVTVVEAAPRILARVASARNSTVDWRTPCQTWCQHSHKRGTSGDFRHEQSDFLRHSFRWHDTRLRHAGRWHRYCCQ